MSDRCYECGSEDAVCADCTYAPLSKHATDLNDMLVAAEAEVERLRAALQEFVDECPGPGAVGSSTGEQWEIDAERRYAERARAALRSSERVPVAPKEAE